MKNTFALALLGLLLCGCSEKPAASKSATIELHPYPDSATNKVTFVTNNGFTFAIGAVRFDDPTNSATNSSVPPK